MDARRESSVREEQKAKIVSIVNEKIYTPLKPKELAHVMQVPDGERPVFDALIDELSQEGYIILSKKGRVLPLNAANLRRGVFTGHPRGFGFVALDEDGSPDVFIAADNINGALHRDVVLCRLLGGAFGSKRAEGEIARIVKRGLDEVVGTFDRESRRGVVTPDDKRINAAITVALADSKNAVSGHKVAVRLTGAPGGPPRGAVSEILGHKDDPGVDITSVVRQMGIEQSFSPEALAELLHIDQTVRPEELAGRRDLRATPTITIDGADTKDVDDAISISPLPDGGFRLGVHIADVSHYVRPGTALDRDALRRGTSVYLADRVIPMLPHELSNGICSLNPSADRLALSCVMDVDALGRVVSHEIFNSVINVDRPINYDAVLELLTDERSPLAREHEDFLPMLQNLEKLAAVLRENRVRRGAIEFAFPETKIVVDEFCVPQDIRPAKRNIATGIIEECMLLCNETIAQEYFWLELPFVFRCHEEPDDEKLREFTAFARHFGYRLKGHGTHPGSLQALLAKTSATPQEAIISRVLLRSFKQARYTNNNIGHFGLAAKYYCHFTSPIRRYPDLQIHRVIKKHISGGDDGFMDSLARALPDICRQCSATERAAQNCEREVENLKKAQYMQQRVGQTFDGIISGITGWGIYVELPNTVEGLAAFHSMDDDHYIYEKERFRCVGQHTGRVYSLGDAVNVTVARASADDRAVEFIINK